MYSRREAMSTGNVLHQVAVAPSQFRSNSSSGRLHAPSHFTA